MIVPRRPRNSRSRDVHFSFNLPPLYISPVFNYPSNSAYLYSSLCVHICRHTVSIVFRYSTLIILLCHHSNPHTFVSHVRVCCSLALCAIPMVLFFFHPTILSTGLIYLKVMCRAAPNLSQVCTYSGKAASCSSHSNDTSIRIIGWQNKARGGGESPPSKPQSSFFRRNTYLLL